MYSQLSTSITTIAISCFAHLTISVKQSTIATYYSVFRSYIEPYWGTKVITDIRLQDYTGLITTLSLNNLSPRTLCLVATVLRHIFEYARLMELEVIDPERIKRPKTIYGKIEILNDQEYQTLIEYCRYNSSTVTLGILLTLFTGLRIGELCALQWKDIDRSTGILTVNKTVLRINNTDAYVKNKTKLIIDSPKSSSSTRSIPIPNCIIDYVESLRGTDESFLLTGTSKFFEPRYYRKLYYKALEYAGIKHYSYHALRHTFATNCVNLGFNPKILSEILGHSDVSITFNTYIHTSLEAMKRDMGKLTID